MEQPISYKRFFDLIDQALPRLKPNKTQDQEPSFEKRFRDYFAQTEFSFTPPAPLQLPPLPEVYTADLNDEQLAAVNGVSAAPISCVCGGPGTGKYDMVLSRCIMRYALLREPVLILSPSNRLVEQTLRTVLPALLEAGVSQREIYRFGTSTNAFSADYPQILCDPENMESYEALAEQVETQKDLLDTMKRYQMQREQCTSWINFAKAENENVVSRIRQIRGLEDQLRNAQALYSEADTGSRRIEAENNASLTLVSDLREQIGQCEKQLEECRHKEDKLKRHFFLKKNLQQCRDDAAKAEQTLTQLRQRLDEAQAGTDTRSGQLAQLRARMNDAAAAAGLAKEQHSHALRELAEITTRCETYHADIQTILDEKKDPVPFLRERYTQQMSALTEARSWLADKDLNWLAREYEQKQAEFDQIDRAIKQKKLQNALVLAGTFDASLGKLIRSRRFSHVFVTDATLVSLARGMSAFSWGTPVTLLCDEQRSLSARKGYDSPLEQLWSIPLTYYSELVYGDPETLCARYANGHTAPSLRDVARFTLNRSARFTPEFSRILGDAIYGEEFQGTDDAPFRFETIDAPHICREQNNNSSKDEAERILEYILSHPSEDPVILTPYKDQRKLLIQTLPSEYKDRIHTIQSVFGQEWDTVIVSVVETSSPYLMSSANPVGLNCLSAVSSSVRRKLVIVCDHKAWLDKDSQMISNKDSQMISDIIRSAKV